MPEFVGVLPSNRELAEKISSEARGNPNSPYRGKIVGLANGTVVAVADDWDDIARLVREAESDPSKTFCFEPDVDYPEVEEIWRLG